MQLVTNSSPRDGEMVEGKREEGGREKKKKRKGITEGR
jgi:hypothetical protein